MKANISGKVYNTETAREIERCGGEALYAKRLKDFFIAGEGGIKLIGAEEAKAWAESRLEGREKSDALIKIQRLKDVSPRVDVTCIISPSEKIRFEALREQRGFENGDIMAAGIDALEREGLGYMPSGESLKEKARIGSKAYNPLQSRGIAYCGGESLHVKQSGECFTAGEGGTKPLSLDDARAWIESRLEGIEKKDAARKLPRRGPAEGRIQLKSYMTHSEKDRIDALREARGFEISEVMAAGIEALEEGLI